MRLDVDHPRTFHELSACLNAAECLAFANYLLAHGLNPYTAPASAIEGCYQDWRLSGLDAGLPTVALH